MTLGKLARCMLAILLNYDWTVHCLAQHMLAGHYRITGWARKRRPLRL